MSGFKRPRGIFSVVAKRRKIGLGRAGAPARKLYRASAVAVKATRAVGYGKRRRTYRRLKRGHSMVKANSTFRKAVKMIENEDKEMKYTSVARLNADIIANAAGSWTRTLNDVDVSGDANSNITFPTTSCFLDANAWQKVVVGDSIVLNREGSEIYPKRIDFYCQATFQPSTTGIKVPYAMLRIWIVQAKHLASSTTPTWQLWQGEAKSGEIWKAYDGKPTQWFDPRSNSNSSQKNQFKVLKKMLIKIKNPYIGTDNAPYGDVAQSANGIAVPAGTAANPTGGPYTTGSAITTTLKYNNVTGVKQFFRSAYLKSCSSVVFGSDTSGDPSMGQLYVMCQGWSPYANSVEGIDIDLFHRVCYKEDPGC